MVGNHVHIQLFGRLYQIAGFAGEAAAVSCQIGTDTGNHIALCQIQPDHLERSLFAGNTAHIIDALCTGIGKDLHQPNNCSGLCTNHSPQCRMGSVCFPDLHQCQFAAGFCLYMDKCRTVAAVLAADLHTQGVAAVFRNGHGHAPLKQVVHIPAHAGFHGTTVGAGLQCGNCCNTVFGNGLHGAGLHRCIGFCFAGIDMQSVPCQCRKCIYSNCIIFHHAHLTQCCLSFPDESDCSFRSHIPAAVPWKRCLQSR